ncbi:hypothetical protein BDP67DRAFT_525167 [Colletotrichum lupini]|nr:hypothetical protein BDP67DRAFT_525167 [Colletotrichum lupini]
MTLACWKMVLLSIATPRLHLGHLRPVANLMKRRSTSSSSWHDGLGDENSWIIETFGWLLSEGLSKDGGTQGENRGVDNGFRSLSGAVPWL